MQYQMKKSRDWYHDLMLDCVGYVQRYGCANDYFQPSNNRSALLDAHRSADNHYEDSKNTNVDKDTLMRFGSREY